ncbi:MAG: metalloregulator ArsR/SmtB family transcription factor [Patescibacteria group bacterium]
MTSDNILKTDQHKLNKALTAYKALADKTRLEIILHLHKKQGEMNCSQITEHFQLSQPAVSHHCKKLLEAKAVQLRQEGTMNYLSLDYEVLDDLGINLDVLAL